MFKYIKFLREGKYRRKGSKQKQKAQNVTYISTWTEYMLCTIWSTVSWILMCFANLLNWANRNNAPILGTWHVFKLHISIHCVAQNCGKSLVFEHSTLDWIPVKQGLRPFPTADFSHFSFWSRHYTIFIVSTMPTKCVQGNYDDNYYINCFRNLIVNLW